MNVSIIRKSGELFCATELVRRSGNTSMLRAKRRDSVIIPFGSDSVHVRDQAPLYENNIEFDQGLTFADWIEVLNGHVFFWPGTKKGPIGYGQRHFEKYRLSSPCMLRIEFNAIVAANTMEPRFSKYNSGSPRCSKGNRSPRGIGTFVLSEEASFAPSACVEVTFLKQVKLPEEVYISKSPNGSWQRL
jgi:hypothetical protein